jgi:hypothetical protein
MTTATKQLTVTRAPEYAGFAALGSRDEPGDEFLLQANGHTIGGTYFCAASNIRDGQRWASWGPAGLSMRHATREDAEAVQIAALDISTLPAPAPEPAPRPVREPEPPVAMDDSFAEKVAAVMEPFQSDDPCGNWLVARDDRDNSAVVVFRTVPGWPQSGIRRTLLYRWVLALRDAGFNAYARDDMEVFGRPDELSATGPWWIHVTAA